MPKPCKESGCTTPSRALGLCRAHYQAHRRRLYGRNDYVPKRWPTKPKRGTCQHLDCERAARYRFTLPNPLSRQERACREHAQPLLGSFIKGTTVEDI